MESEDKTNTTSTMEGEDRTDTTLIMEGGTKSTESVQKLLVGNFEDKNYNGKENLTGENNIAKENSETEEQANQVTTVLKDEDIKVEGLDEESRRGLLIDDVKASSLGISLAEHDGLSNCNLENTETKDSKQKRDLNIPPNSPVETDKHTCLTEPNSEIDVVPNIVKKNSNIAYEAFFNLTLKSLTDNIDFNKSVDESAMNDPTMDDTVINEKQEPNLPTLSTELSDNTSSTKLSTEESSDKRKPSSELDSNMLEPIKITNENFDKTYSANIEKTINDKDSNILKNVNSKKDKDLMLEKCDDTLYEYENTPSTSKDLNFEKIESIVSDTDTKKKDFAKCLAKFLRNFLCSSILLYLLYASVSIFSPVFGIESDKILAAYIIFGSIGIPIYYAYLIKADGGLKYKKHGIEFGWALPFIIGFIYLRSWSLNCGITLYQVIQKI